MSKLFPSLLFFAALSLNLNAATWYVDNTATGSQSGTSWANAWTALSQVSGIAPGDTVYISGGPSGSSRTYSLGSDGWSPAGGTSGNIITYQIGQDSAHNGTAVFSGSGNFVNGNLNYLAIVGDAGDGNMHFSTSGFSTIQWTDSGQQSVRYGYINFGRMAGSGGQNGNVMYANPINGLEFDHNYVYLSAPDANAFAYFQFDGSTWDDNKIHDNSIYIPHDSGGNGGPGFGADCFESGGSVGFSIYNNTITGFSIIYTGGQHQDGWQDTGGSSYIKIYGNTFYNIGDYCVYGDTVYDGFTHLWVYNNIAVITDPAVQNGSPGAFVIGVDGGLLTGNALFTDVAIVNNLTDSYLGNQGISLNNVTSFEADFVNCVIANNISLNGGEIDTEGNTTSTVEDNVALTTAQGPENFISYTANSANNDYNLLATATSLIGQGANFSSYFTTDLNGSARPSTGAWTVGPYVYDAPVAPPTGLIDWWQGEGNADDSVGTDNGTLRGGVSYASGEIGQAFSFDGSTGFVSTPVPYLTSAANNFTIEFWAWPTANRASTSQSQTGIEGAGGQRYAIFPSNPGDPNAGVGISVGNNGISVFEDGPFYLPSLLVYNAPIVGWTHIAVVYNNRQPSLYVNGQFKATGLQSQRSASYPSTSLGEQGFGYGYYSGLLDEVSIYNRALGANEIQAIYQARTFGKSGSVPTVAIQPVPQTVRAGSSAAFSVDVEGLRPMTYQWYQGNTAISPAVNATAAQATLILTDVQQAQSGSSYSVVAQNRLGSVTSASAVLTVNPVPPCVSVPAGLISWWKGEGDANDSYGVNNGTVQTGVGFTPLGEVGQAFNFHFSSGYVDVPDSSSLELSGQISIEGWINPQNPNDGQGQTIVYKLGTQSGPAGYGLGLIGNQLAGFFYGAYGTLYSVIAPITFEAGTWTHVAWTYDQSVMKLYCNGQLVTSEQIGPAQIVTSRDDLLIGPGASYNTAIDELSLYNTALTADQISAIYAAGSSGKCPSQPQVVVSMPSSSPASSGGTGGLGVKTGPGSTNNISALFASLVQQITKASQPRIVPKSDGSVQIIFKGKPGTAYRVQSTASLQTPKWQDVATNVADQLGNIIYADTPATNSPARYYRSVTP